MSKSLLELAGFQIRSDPASASGVRCWRSPHIPGSTRGRTPGFYSRAAERQNQEPEARIVSGLPPASAKLGHPGVQRAPGVAVGGVRGVRVPLAASTHPPAPLFAGKFLQDKQLLLLRYPPQLIPVHLCCPSSKVSLVRCQAPDFKHKEASGQRV